MNIENEYLRVQIADRGAELCSLYDKELGAELLWQADPAYWGRHAPVLFPFVGKVNGGVYRWGGRTYAMGQHGFARDMEFVAVSSEQDSCVHVLRSDADTLRAYPFPFMLEISHILDKNALLVRWRVFNPGEGPMYFSIGGHPAFNCPVLPGERREDYTVRFGGREEMTYALLDAQSGCVDTDRTYRLRVPAGGLPLTRELFDRDALIFDGQVEEASICAPDGEARVTLRCPGFPSFGLWSRPRSDAPYVCLEPWCGRADDAGFAGELSEKALEQRLEAGETFEREYRIIAGRAL